MALFQFLFYHWTFLQLVLVGSGWLKRGERWGVEMENITPFFFMAQFLLYALPPTILTLFTLFFVFLFYSFALQF